MFRIMLAVAFLVIAGITPGCASSPKANTAAVIAGNNQFAFDLYAQLRDRPGNLFFSPESISTALAMTYAGARGETAEQMARTLHFTLESEQLNHAFHALVQELNGGQKKRDYELRVANALWGQRGFGFLPSFLQLLQSSYGAGLREVDFSGDTEAARRTINAWVEQETQDKIKDLLKPGVIDSLTRLVLTNAIYFKGDWDRQFKKNLTQKQTFHLSAEQKTEVPMMHQTGMFKYLDAGAFQALELPYKEKELSMVVLLPREADGLTAFEQTLTPSVLDSWLARMRSEEVIVALPKFKSTSEFSLAETLSAMGMPQLFTPGQADLSGMNGKRDLFVKAVVHKAFVDVNEEGTEAAAATGVVVAKRAAVPVRTQFVADRPFVYLIRDNHSGSILFLGRLADPR
jgi:serpin B